MRTERLSFVTFEWSSPRLEGDEPHLDLLLHFLNSRDVLAGRISDSLNLELQRDVFVKRQR